MNSKLTVANDLYKRSLVTFGVGKSLREGFLKRALANYHSEISKVSEANRPPLWRNIGTSSLGIAKVLDKKNELEMIFYYLSEAVKYLTFAWMGRSEQTHLEWRNKIEDIVSQCFEVALQSIDGDIESDRIPKFHLLSQIELSISSGHNLDIFRGRFHMAKAQYFFLCGVISNEQSNVRITAQLLEYCREERELALKCSKSFPEIVAEADRLEDEIWYLLYSCESVRLLNQADSIFATYMTETDEVNFDMMWNVLDMYKASEICCREVDLENEAIALARQGRLFAKVFLLKNRAKDYYRKAFDLAVSMMPRDFTSSSWFQECKNALETFQKESLAEEEKRKETERAPYMLELKPELEKLNEVHLMNDPFKLLKFLYHTHPPKRGNFKYDENSVTADNIKRTLMTAITQYHPDKQVEFGMKWKVLSEEITKCLNARYESLKGV